MIWQQSQIKLYIQSSKRVKQNGQININMQQPIDFLDTSLYQVENIDYFPLQQQQDPEQE